MYRPRAPTLFAMAAGREAGAVFSGIERTSAPPQLRPDVSGKRKRFCVISWCRSQTGGFTPLVPHSRKVVWATVAAHRPMAGRTRPVGRIAEARLGAVAAVAGRRGPGRGNGGSR